MWFSLYDWNIKTFFHFLWHSRISISSLQLKHTLFHTPPHPPTYTYTHTHMFPHATFVLFFVLLISLYLSPSLSPTLFLPLSFSLSLFFSNTRTCTHTHTNTHFLFLPHICSPLASIGAFLRCQQVPQSIGKIKSTKTISIPFEVILFKLTKIFHQLGISFR